MPNINYMRSILMVCCTILYSLHTCLTRYFRSTVNTEISSDLIICYQYVISMVILLPFIVPKLFKQNLRYSPKIIKYYLIRCTIIACAAILWMYALSRVKAVNCIAISCLTPILILIFAKFALKEYLSTQLILLALIALTGAFLIQKPDIHQLNFPSILAFITAILWAINSVFTKKYLSPYHSAMTIFFITVIVLSIIAVPYIFIKPHMINFTTISFLGAITIIFDCANILLIWCFSSGKISFIATFDFLRVVFTSIFANFILKESINSNAFIGIIIILGANILAATYNFKQRNIATT